MVLENEERFSESDKKRIAYSPHAITSNKSENNRGSGNTGFVDEI